MPTYLKPDRRLIDYLAGSIFNLSYENALSIKLYIEHIFAQTAQNRASIYGIIAWYIMQNN